MRLERRPDLYRRRRSCSGFSPRFSPAVVCCSLAASEIWRLFSHTGSRRNRTKSRELLIDEASSFRLFTCCCRLLRLPLGKSREAKCAPNMTLGQQMLDSELSDSPRAAFSPSYGQPNGRLARTSAGGNKNKTLRAGEFEVRRTNGHCQSGRMIMLIHLSDSCSKSAAPAASVELWTRARTRAECFLSREKPLLIYKSTGERERLYHTQTSAQTSDSAAAMNCILPGGGPISVSQSKSTAAVGPARLPR